MKSAGMKCVLARDMTGAHPGYDPSRGFTPDLNTEQVVEHFERYLSSTIDFEEELRRWGRWPEDELLDPVRSVGFGHTYGGQVRYSGMTQAPQKDRSNRGEELRLDRRVFVRGLGVHAPCEVTYAIPLGARRFVALAGVDENLVRLNHGSNLARYPSVVFKVFIDGREVAGSPVMRMQTPAWRFDVALPEGARKLSLVVMDAGDGNREDYANWAEAGFVMGRQGRDESAVAR